MNQEQIRLLGELLRQRRLELGVSAKSLAGAAGVHHTTVLRIEGGQFGAPRLDGLARLAELLGCSLGELFIRIGYLLGEDLPELNTYLMARCTELPKAALAELLAFFSDVIKRYGIVLPKRKPIIGKAFESVPTAGELASDPEFQAEMQAAAEVRPEAASPHPYTPKNNTTTNKTGETEVNNDGQGAAA